MENVQSLDYPNLVHVVLDNGSADATPDTIKQYIGRGCRFWRPERCDPADGRSKAVSLIPKEAEYFWLLCADDTLAPQAIRRTMDVAESDPSVVLAGSLWRADGFVVGEELQRGQTVFEGKAILRGYVRREHTAPAGEQTDSVFAG
jgi:GT2 family glycosyltransferase